jgi:Flp pilus assembly pilin Flp
LLRLGERDAGTKEAIAATRRKKGMTTILTGFSSDERGQDIAEYTLLLAFVAMASAVIFISFGNSISVIWGAGATQLTVANTSVS